MKITELSRSPSRAGRIDGPDAGGRSVNFDCGSRVSVEISMDGDLVSDIRFSANGCAYLIAAAEVIADEIDGSCLRDLHSLADRDLAALVGRRTGELPADRRGCLNAAVEALHAAFKDLRERRVHAYTGDASLICTCFGVSEEMVENCIAEHALDCVDAVTERCRAGGGCGSCRMLIQELIDIRNHPVGML